MCSRNVDTVDTVDTQFPYYLSKPCDSRYKVGKLGVYSVYNGQIGHLLHVLSTNQAADVDT